MTTIDLRSDTVTKPTEAMKEAMFSAEVGDDVLGDDPTVKALEAKSALLFGHEAALFCPSGTMCNQIAIKTHTNAPGEVVCDNLSHIYRYEGGGIAFNSGLSARLIYGDKGRFTVRQLQEEINADDIHFPPTQLVSIENTCNKGGGSLWELDEIIKISSFCKSNKLPFHLDGARIFNALVAQQISSKEMGKQFDSISICLSKGLGCPIGSVLIGNKEFIQKANRIRKILGGGMRQSGFLAAAGIYALDNNVERLAKDHLLAKKLADLMQAQTFVKSVQTVESNILLFDLDSENDDKQFIQKLAEQQLLVSSMGHQRIRMVTHLGVDESILLPIKKILASL